MENKKTLVIGASENPERYANKAIKLLLQHKHTVVALGNKAGNVNEVIIETERKPFNDIDTVTLYINPTIQKDYYSYILSLKPNRIIFNPVTENQEFMDLANQHNIANEEACTLVLLHTNQY